MSHVEFKSLFGPKRFDYSSISLFLKEILTIREIIEKQDRQYAGKTAPAKGLFFLGPKYKEENTINSYLPNLFDRFKH